MAIQYRTFKLKTQLCTLKKEKMVFIINYITNSEFFEMNEINI